MVDLKRGRIIGDALLLTVLAPVVVCAQSVPVPFRWTAPRVGAAVTHYNVYQIEDGGSPQLVGTATDTTYVLAASRGVHTRIQVSGVALDGREGPLSLPSDEVFFEIPQAGEEMPSAPLLRPNFPNPFNPQTTIAYGVPEGTAPGAALSLEVYDLRGHLVRRLPVDSSPGWHGVLWDGRDDAGSVRGSGQYMIRFRCGGAVKTWKMTMLK
ncbi:MAG: FlgD immunoglobulin-like domain containing protein [Candidatus Krumholzibacteriia bacterium]